MLYTTPFLLSGYTRLFISKMKLLGQYIGFKIENCNVARFAEYASGVHVQEILYLLNTIVIEEREEVQKRPVPRILISKAQCCYHEECINLMVEYLMEKGIDNQLTVGATLASSFDPSAPYTFKGHNSSIEMLKSAPMNIIKNVIGIEFFYDILLNSTAFWKTNNVMLWGAVPKKSFTAKAIPKSVSLRRMLHVNKSQLQKNSPVPETSWLLLQNVFADMGLSSKKRANDPPKRLRKVFKLLKILLNNHKSRMLEYPYILDQIVNKSQREIPFNNLSLSTPKSQIIEFIFTVVYMIIPLGLFGTKTNRTKMMRNIPLLINCNIFHKERLVDIMDGIKLNDIGWLKPRNDVSLTRQEFLCAKSLFSSFVVWLFEEFVCKMVSSFFYVTEASQKNRYLFYKHSLWTSLTKKYMSKYFNENLIKVEDTKNTFDSFTNNKDFIGSLYLQPKKDNFRLIVKPFKGNPDEKISYLTFQKNYIRPINFILNSIRDKNGCSSTIDLVDKIYCFKRHLLHKYNSNLPKIHAYKFDVKNAYDSLPHSVIENTIQQKLDEFTPREDIFVQLCEKTNSKGIMRKKCYIIVDSLEKLDLNHTQEDAALVSNNTNSIILDLHETLHFTKSEIMEFVFKQYRNTCFHSKSKSYYRKIGLYQGFHLSGTIFNIVYDQVVKSFYEKVCDDDETCIIRLMDDFLILSTSSENIEIIKKLTARCIGEYNLNINRLKSQSSTTELSFAGMKINVCQLVCLKSVCNYNNAPLQASSFPRLYKQLLKYATRWCKNKSLFESTLDKSEISGSRSNLFALLNSIIYKFCNSYKTIRVKQSFDLATFCQFLENLILVVSKEIFVEHKTFHFDSFRIASLKILKDRNILQRTNNNVKGRK